MQSKTSKWMPHWKQLRSFVKTDEELFELFFQRHGFLSGGKATPKALKRGIIRIGYKGNDEWSVNKFLQYWIEDREEGRLSSWKTAKEDKRMKQPQVANSTLETMPGPLKLISEVVYMVTHNTGRKKFL